MSQIQIGLSAIRASQAALTTISNNITNASTEGYHRQRVEHVDRALRIVGDLVQGGGVDVGTISRLRDHFVEQSLTFNISQKSAAGASLETAQQIERLFTPSEGSIHTVLADYFNNVEQLTTRPEEIVLRNQVVSSAKALATSINEITRGLDDIVQQIELDLREAVSEVNQLAANIADLNQDIRLATGSGETPNSLLDQRDRLINELAEYVDIDAGSLLRGGDPIIAAGGTLIIGTQVTHLDVLTTDTTPILEASTGLAGEFVERGKIAGYFQSLHELSETVQPSFQEWAQRLIGEIDQLHATGLGLHGAGTEIIGQRGVADPDVPLAEAGALFPVTSGDLAITVTDNSGQRTTHTIGIDVGSDSLRDVAERLDLLAGVTATVIEPNGTLDVRADAGSTIDFAGRPDQSPFVQAITGTSAPTVSGIYLGESNTQWDVEVVNGGTVSASFDVRLRITNASTGDVVKEISVGQGYASGDAVEIVDGIQFQFASGTLNAGDAFSVQLHAQPDETNLLANLGLGTLFSGNSFATLKVHQDILKEPTRFAASRSGNEGEARQLDRIIQLRERPLFSATTDTLEERLAALTAETGVRVKSTRQEIEQREAQHNELRNAQDAVSGVDPNEELILMLQYQRAFEAAARFTSSINETFDQLLSLVR